VSNQVNLNEKLLFWTQEDNTTQKKKAYWPGEESDDQGATGQTVKSIKPTSAGNTNKVIDRTRYINWFMWGLVLPLLAKYSIGLRHTLVIACCPLDAGQPNSMHDRPIADFKDTERPPPDQKLKIDTIIAIEQH